MMDSENFRAGRAAAALLSPDKRIYPVSLRKRLTDALSTLSLRADQEKEGWLHDNYYVIFREGHAALSYFKQRIQFRASDGEIVMMCLCDAYLKTVKGEITHENADEYWRGVLSVIDLEEKELAAFRAFIGAGIIFSLETADQKASEKLIKSIRTISDKAFSELAEHLSPIEKALAHDAIYIDMDKATRSLYRKRIEKLADKSHRREKELAEEFVSLSKKESRHVGELLFPTYGKDTPEPICYGVILYILASFCSILVWRTGKPLLALVTWPVVYELIKQMIDAFLLKVVDKPPLFSMEFHDEIPSSEASMAVITCVAKNKGELEKLYEALEEHYLSERGGKNLIFGLLIDLPEAKEPNKKRLDMLKNVMEDNCRRLEERYGQPFASFLRAPVYLERDKKYAGWERKRGALTDLIAFLARGVETPFYYVHTAMDQNFRHLITLDRDTVPYPGSIVSLVAAAAHTMNRPVIRGTHVREGFGILEPTLLLSPKSLEKNRFSRFYGGNGGNDVYSPSVRGFYESLFGRTPFGGKGLIDVMTADKLLPDAFPEGCILSHDTPEGGILRAGKVNGAVFFEDFPTTPFGYYKRLDRWTRGDAQNVRLLFKMDGFTGFLILDNIRRAMTPLFLFLTIAVSMYMREYLWESIAFLIIFTPFLKEIWHLSRSGGEYAPCLLTLGDTDHARAFKASVLKLMLLPYEAYVTQRALIVGWVRGFITKRKQLEWSVDERREESLGAYFQVFMLPSLIASVVFPFLALLWLPSFWVLWMLGRKKEEASFTEEEKHYIREAVFSSMRFFRETCRPEWGYLPADSLQIYPATGIGPRTSPTDIGMFLLAAVSFADMGLEGAEQMIDTACRCLETTEKLPGQAGHLYNWYDLTTMTPTLPKVISSVDSGNLRASLYVFSEAMREIGRDEDAERARIMADNMSFRPFYKEDKELLAVAYDAEKQKLTDNDYDLYESEARIASFLAVAHGEAPAKHWKKLGRAVKTWRGAAGSASWGGTMFEYLTPYLFMKAPEGTLARESEAFAVFAEKIAGRRKRLPWGISESAFYAFDDALNYRYKAHGVSELATAPSRTGEYVISPYSVFLALESEGSVENLRKIEALGGRGKYGFFEALDASDPDHVRPVECYMPHHIGMQAAAAANALCGGIHRKRFMRITEHKALERLFWETARHSPRADAVSGEAPPATLGNAEGARLITNPRMSVKGEAKLSLNGSPITLNAVGIAKEAPKQMTFILTHRGESVSLLPQKVREGRHYETVFAKDKVLYAYKEKDFVSELRLTAGNDPRLSLTLTSHAPQVENFHVAASKGGNAWMQIDLSLMPGEQKTFENKIDG